MWSVIVQDMLEEENPDLYWKMQMDGTLTEYVKGNAAIMADGVKTLSPSGDPMSRSEAHEIVIAEMRAKIRRGGCAIDCENRENREDCEDCEEMLAIMEVFNLDSSGNLIGM